MSQRIVPGLVAALLALAAVQARAQPSTNLDDYVLFAVTTLKTKGPTTR